MNGLKQFKSWMFKSARIDSMELDKPYTIEIDNEPVNYEVGVEYDVGLAPDGSVEEWFVYDINLVLLEDDAYRDAVANGAQQIPIEIPDSEVTDEDRKIIEEMTGEQLADMHGGYTPYESMVNAPPRSAMKNEYGEDNKMGSKQVIDLYNEGKSIREISDALVRHPNVIKAIIRQAQKDGDSVTWQDRRGTEQKGIVNDTDTKGDEIWVLTDNGTKALVEKDRLTVKKAFVNWLHAKKPHMLTPLIGWIKSAQASDEFNQAYVEAALWASSDTDPETGEMVEGLDGWEGDLSEEALKAMLDDADRFQEENAELLARAYSEDGMDAAHQGHDFWLTRNGHGAGYWDGDYPTTGDELTEAAEAFGESNLYIGDDRQIHLARRKKTAQDFDKAFDALGAGNVNVVFENGRFKADTMYDGKILRSVGAPRYFGEDEYDEILSKLSEFDIGINVVDKDDIGKDAKKHIPEPGTPEYDKFLEEDYYPHILMNNGFKEHELDYMLGKARKTPENIDRDIILRVVNKLGLPENFELIGDKYFYKDAKKKAQIDETYEMTRYPGTEITDEELKSWPSEKRKKYNDPKWLNLRNYRAVIEAADQAIKSLIILRDAPNLDDDRDEIQSIMKRIDEITNKVVERNQDQLVDILGKEGARKFAQDMLPGQEELFDEEDYQSAPYLVSKTYEIITPESSELGDFEETGFEYQNETMDREDLIREIEDEGFHLESHGTWFNTVDPHRDYSDGAETYYSLHVKHMDGTELDYEELKEIYDATRYKMGQKEDKIQSLKDFDGLNLIVGDRVVTTTPDGEGYSRSVSEIVAIDNGRVGIVSVRDTEDGTKYGANTEWVEPNILRKPENKGNPKKAKKPSRRLSEFIAMQRDKKRKN